LKNYSEEEEGADSKLKKQWEEAQETLRQAVRKALGAGMVTSEIVDVVAEVASGQWST
jgi:hypothetical protein